MSGEGTEVDNMARVLKPPFTYLINYGEEVLSDEFIAKLAEAPPKLLHVGLIMPFKSAWGATTGFSSRAHGFGRLLPPEKVEESMDGVKRFISKVREAGVEYVIPYICSQTIVGDHVKRTGFWEFYDRWEDYLGFGVPPKPDEDPINWMQQEYICTPNYQYPLIRYRPCINNPYWREWLRFVARQIASLGYDGVFVDNNVMSCYCSRCQRKFREYLSSKYTPEELKKRLGFSDPDKALLGREGDGPLWAETQYFWNESMASLLREVRDEGRRVKPDFIVVANWGSMLSTFGADMRRREGKNVAAWAKAVDYIMFEEPHDPGLYRTGDIIEYVLQYSYARAVGAAPVVLPYASSEHTSELAHAEAAAGNGVFVHPGRPPTRVYAKYNRFYSENRHLWEGVEEYAEVGVAYLYSQIHMDNVAHMRQAHRLVRYLSGRHVLYSLIAEDRFNALGFSRYRVVILPEVRYLSDSEADEIEKYVSSGGILVLTGATSLHDENGRRREDFALRKLFSRHDPWTEELFTSRYGAGYVIYSRLMTTLLPKNHYDLDAFSPGGAYPSFLRLSREGLIKHMTTVTEQGEVYDYRGGDLLLDLLADLLGYRLELTDSPGTASLRFTAYASSDRLILHMVNYAVPVALPRRGGGMETEPIPVPSFTVSLRTPVKKSPSSIRLLSPDSGVKELKWSMYSNTLTLEVPGLRLYGVVEASFH